MMRHISKSLWLLGLTLVICCAAYPLVIWAVGQTVFPEQANGSLVRDPDGKIVGSRLIAQPFTKDEYFQPRPSAPSYDASAGASSTLAPSNYLLRARVASALGPIVKYRSGPKAGQLVAPDIEAWFQQDRYKGKPSYRRPVGRRSQRPGAGVGQGRSNPRSVRRRVGQNAQRGSGAVDEKQPRSTPACGNGSGGGFLREFFQRKSR